MLINEIFQSIQGESTYAGLPCVFVRFGGCNLACSWCDTPYAQTTFGARDLAVDEVMAEVKKYRCGLVEITGGEPLMQEEAEELAAALLDAGCRVLIETNGSISLEGIDRRAIKVVDVKCPSSGFAGAFLVENIGFITKDDEVKFVIADMADYEFAKRFIEEYLRDATQKVLFAPVSPGLPPKTLAEWILKDGLSVRLQLQMHKYVWGNERGR
ncbi:MAG: radical SAM protein [Deltaproteobacteria bacterium]|nr:radical SAM protein [Deltaproteobacteria bacterium]